jgi:hypothetical protein
MSKKCHKWEEHQKKEKEFFTSLKQYFEIWENRYDHRFPYDERNKIYEVKEMIELTEEWEI